MWFFVVNEPSSTGLNPYAPCLSPHEPLPVSAAGRVGGGGRRLGRLGGQRREEGDRGAGPTPAFQHQRIGKCEGNIGRDRDALAKGGNGGRDRCPPTRQGGGARHGAQGGNINLRRHRGGGGLEEALEPGVLRSEEQTSELQSLMRNSYAVFCLKKKRTKHN